MTPVRVVLAAIVCAAAGFVALPAVASDATDVQAVVAKWVADFNKGDMPAFLDVCAPRVAVVDGFPPYAWTSCEEWIADYEANNKRIEATPGKLWIGKPVYSEITADHAYLIYPARFVDTQKGKTVTYKGTWTMTLRRTGRGWQFTGSASAWTS
jgi:hypothetical protein